MSCWVVSVVGLLTVLVVLSVSNVDALAKENLKIVAVLRPPFVMKNPHSGKFEGLMIDVLEEANIAVDHITTPVHDMFGFEEHPGEFNGAMGDLIDGKYDLAVAPFSIRSNEASYVTFTQSIIHYGFMVLYKLPQDSGGHFNRDALATLMRPFSAGLWSLIVGVTVMVSIVLYVIRRFSPYEKVSSDDPTLSEEEKSSRSWGSGLMYLIGSITGRGDSGVSPRSTSGRILTGVWWLFSLMTLGAYVAELVIIMYRFNPHQEPLKYSSIEDMITGPEVKVLGVKNSSTFEYMSRHRGPYEKMIYKYWTNNWEEVMVDSLDTALKMVNEGDGKYGVLMEEALADYFASQEPCDKVVVGEDLGDDFIGFACKRGSSVCDRLDHVILNLQESGRIDELRKKWFWNECRKNAELVLDGRAYVDTYGKEPGILSQHSVTIHRFAAAFLVLLVGFSLAAILLLVEIIYSRSKGDVHHRLKYDVSRYDGPGHQGQEFTLDNN